VAADSASVVYDAFDRTVEQASGSSYAQILYSPSGAKLALATSPSALKMAFIPLPAGATAVYNSTGLAYYRHPDWLGSSRFASTPSRTMYSSTAYAPFGESYAEAGTKDRSFTGQGQDTAEPLYDFLFRKYSSTQGRWISPDPAGLTAVDPSNPQSWNRYAYVLNNSIGATDPLGLIACPLDDNGDFVGKDCGADGSGNGGGGGCTMDGVSTDCSLVYGVLQMGAGIQCPNHDCSLMHYDDSGLWRTTPLAEDYIRIGCVGSFANPTENCQTEEWTRTYYDVSFLDNVPQQLTLQQQLAQQQQQIKQLQQQIKQLEKPGYCKALGGAGVALLGVAGGAELYSAYAGEATPFAIPGHIVAGITLLADVGVGGWYWWSCT